MMLQGKTHCKLCNKVVTSDKSMQFFKRNYSKLRYVSPPLRRDLKEARRNIFKSSGDKPMQVGVIYPSNWNMVKVSAKSKWGKIPTDPICSAGPDVKGLKRG